MDKPFSDSWAKNYDRRGNGGLGELFSQAGQAVSGLASKAAGGIGDLVKKLSSGKSKDEKALAFARLMRDGHYSEVHDEMGLKEFAELRDYAISKGIIDGDEYDQLVKDAYAKKRTPAEEAAKPNRDPESKDLFNQTVDDKASAAKTNSQPSGGAQSTNSSAPSASFDYSTNKTGKANSTIVAQYEPAPTGGRERAYSATTEGYQTKLNAIGFSVGEADGFFGDATKAAVTKFQKANNLSPTGNIDQATADKIDELSSQDDTAGQGGSSQGSGAGGLLD